MTSAVRVGGERLYRRPTAARSWRPPSATSTSTGRSCSSSDGERARYEIECSAGTYIRTLVETLGDAYCEELRRTAIGPFADRGRRRRSSTSTGSAPWSPPRRRRCDSGGLMAQIKVTSLPDAEPRPRHVAIGTFDGVHRGHRAVIDDADTVLTFDPHPLEILHPAALPKLIMPFEVKRDVIEGLGVEELVVIPFDEEFAQRSAEDFIEHVLVERLGAERVSVGENFRFGAKAKGDPEMLSAREEFETRVVPLVEVDGETVSSTRIRALVAAGDMEGARHCLGAPFMVEGTVVHRRPARPRAGLPDRQHRPRRPPRDPRPRRLRGLRQRRPRGGQRRRAADLRERPRGADRDLPDRPRRRPLRHRAAGRLRRAPARREALRRGRGADRPDEDRRRGRQARLRQLPAAR